MSTPLSVLDLASVSAGQSHADALADTLAVAREADRLGYTRFWVAEHHGMGGVASSAPAVLIGALAGATRRIRVGSGGVMLPNHSSLVIAEQFGTLVALHGDRIDLGLGRAPGTDPVTTQAVRRGAVAETVDDFPTQVLELLAYFGTIPPLDTGAGSRVVAVPGAGDAPAMWLLGSSDFSARLAGMMGLPFAFAHHFAGGENTRIVFRIYRDSFRPSAVLQQPYSAVAAAALVADSDADARRAYLPSVLQQLRMRTGQRPGPSPTQAEADAYDWQPAEDAFVDSRIAQQAVGSLATVRAQLAALAEVTGADEIIVAPQGPGLAQRLRTLRELAPAADAADEAPGAGSDAADAAADAEAEVALSFAE